MRNAWLGKLFAAEHLFCFRIDGLDGPGVWNLALGSFEESAVIAWPGNLYSVVVEPSINILNLMR